MFQNNTHRSSLAHQMPKYIMIGSVMLLVALGVVFWRTLHKKQARDMAQTLFEAKQEGFESYAKVLKEIQKSNQYHVLGIWSMLELSNAVPAKDSCQTAIQELPRYVGQGENKILRGMVYAKLGGCLEEKGDFKGADALYEKALADRNHFLADYCQFRLALVKRALNQKEESQKILKTLSDKNSKSIELIQMLAKQELEFSGQN